MAETVRRFPVQRCDFGRGILNQLPYVRLILSAPVAVVFTYACLCNKCILLRVESQKQHIGRWVVGLWTYS